MWDGTGNSREGKKVPTGTYFYVVDLGNNAKKITGALELTR